MLELRLPIKKKRHRENLCSVDSKLYTKGTHGFQLELYIQLSCMIKMPRILFNILFKISKISKEVSCLFVLIFLVYLGSSCFFSQQPLANLWGSRDLFIIAIPKEPKYDYLYLKRTFFLVHNLLHTQVSSSWGEFKVINYYRQSLVSSTHFYFTQLYLSVIQYL